MSPERRTGARTKRVAEVIAYEIVRGVARGDIDSQSFPAEAELMQRFRASRASVREALLLLESYGMITVRPGPRGGPTLNEVTDRDFARASTFYYHLVGATFAELVEARSLIEPMMARGAAANAAATDSCSDKIRENLQRTRSLLDAPHDAWSDCVNEFHSIIGGSSGNRILNLFLGSLRHLYFERLDPHLPISQRESVLKEHEDVAEAIYQSDPLSAEGLMSKHMETFTGSMEPRFVVLFEDVLDWR